MARAEMRSSHTTCAEPALSERIGPYCFGDLGEQDREAFERHLLSCDACWREVERLLAGVSVIRGSRDLLRRAQSPDVVGVLGLSGRLERPFGGHVRLAATASVLYALLFAVPVVVEVAYEFDRYGNLAMALAASALVWMLGTTLATLAVDVRHVRRGETGVRFGLSAMAASTVLLCALVVPLLPDRPTVVASFGTWPSNLGYLKSVFYALLVGPVFMFWLFHFVVVMQQQLKGGRHAEVLSLLSGEPRAVAPRGVGHPSVKILTACIVLQFVLNYFGVNNLFSALAPGPYTNLFVALVLVRVTIWLALPVVCLWWFSGSLNELKREAAVVESFSARNAGSTGGG